MECLNSDVSLLPPRTTPCNFALLPERRRRASGRLPKGNQKNRRRLGDDRDGNRMHELIRNQGLTQVLVLCVSNSDSEIRTGCISFKFRKFIQRKLMLISTFSIVRSAPPATADVSRHITLTSLARAQELTRRASIRRECSTLLFPHATKTSLSLNCF